MSEIKGTKKIVGKIKDIFDASLIDESIKNT